MNTKRCKNCGKPKQKHEPTSLTCLLGSGNYHAYQIFKLKQVACKWKNQGGRGKPGSCYFPACSH